MWTVMKFCDFVIGQIRVTGLKDFLLLLLKVLFLMFAAGEMRDSLRYTKCLLTIKSPVWGWAAVSLFKYICIVSVFMACCKGIIFFRRRKKLPRAVSFFAAACLITWCLNGSLLGIYYWDGPYWGRVTDADTGEPVAGASVAGRWGFELFLFVVVMPSYADARETVTDKDGRFFLPAARTFWFWPLSRIRLEEIIVFKPGYDSHPPRMYKAWTDEDDKKWHSKLKPEIRERYYDSVPDSYGKEADWKRILKISRGETYYCMLFEIYGKECRIWKPTVIRLNRAESPEEQREAAAVSLSDVPFCDGKINIPMIKEILSKYK
jgi:hypothetical protein